MSFCELNARSAFSFLHGASPPEAMVARAAELGQPAIAVTDRLGFQGSARAHAAAAARGLRALVGSIVELPDGSPLPVLAASRAGYAALCQNLTTGLLAGPAAGGDSAAPAAGFPAHPFPRGSLIALTGDRDSRLPRLLLAGKKSAAAGFVRGLIETFGAGQVYIQLTRHRQRDDARLGRLLIDLADHFKLPLIASNAPLHARRADRPLADAFACLRHHTTLDRAGALLAPNGERHLRATSTMRELFADVPRAVTETLRLADRLEFTLEDLGYRFPDAADATGHPLSLGEQATELRRRTYHGAHGRYPRLSGAVKDQLERELRMIRELGFPGYFLIVHDLVRFARSHGIFCQGRGSAANSAVCYALGITNVDPVGGGLLFERFLSPNRRSWPDIDLDFPSGERRELVIRHVFEKFGERGAAMTANVITYRPKSAFREMAKVLGFPPQIAERFSQSHAHAPPPRDPAAGRAEDERPDFTAAFVAAGIPENHPRLPALGHLFHAALALPRHLGQHSGGMIICDRGLDRIVPLQPAGMPGRTIVQWDKDDCEDLGIVKVDLLGLGMLAAVEDTLKLCAQRGRDVDPAAIPKDDPAVYDLLCRADTIGTFQVESRAQMATLPVMRPRTFYDLAIEVAIIRPGPIVGDLVHPYLNRRQGIHDVDFIHPSLEPILARTLGVPLFQEQVLRMAMTVAGFDGAEADELRRAMAFKRADEKMRRIAGKLDRGMIARGLDAEARRKVLDAIGSFALYGFPESHAISFALIAYLSCWLKVHRPAEFYAGLINHQPMGFYNVNTLLEDAKRHGVRPLPISAVHSDADATVPDEATLRLGLGGLKGLARRTLARLLEARAERPFANLADFLTRVRPGEKERRILAAAGALDDLPAVNHRREAMWQAELPLHDDLFAAAAPAEAPAPLAPMTAAEELAADLRHTGATTGPHPMALWRAARGSELPRAADLDQLPHGHPLSIAGLVICRQRPSTAKGHCFISLEDETGIANLFIPRDTFLDHRELITAEPFLLVAGRLQLSEGTQPTVFVTGLEALPETAAAAAPPSHDFH